MAPPATEPAGQTGGGAVLVARFVDSASHTFTREDRAAIESVAVAALAEIAAHLPGMPAQIELVVGAEGFVIPETGDLGAALAPGKIGWTADPKREGGVVAVARQRLRTTLFHEVHHLVRGWTMEGGTAGLRMIDAAVAEGMATAFERDAGGWSPPWGDYPADQVRAWVEEILALPASAPYAQWMFVHPDGRKWIGYRTGTYLIDQAMRASGRSAAELVAMPTDEVVALARSSAGRSR